MYTICKTIFDPMNMNRLDSNIDTAGLPVGRKIFSLQATQLFLSPDWIIIGISYVFKLFHALSVSC